MNDRYIVVPAPGGPSCEGYFVVDTETGNGKNLGYVKATARSKPDAFFVAGALNAATSDLALCEDAVA